MTTWSDMIHKQQKDETVQKQPARIRLSNAMHVLADDIEVSIANAAVEHEIPPEDVLDWITNELQNRRTVCTLRR